MGAWEMATVTNVATRCEHRQSDATTPSPSTAIPCIATTSFFRACRTDKQLFRAVVIRHALQWKNADLARHIQFLVQGGKINGRLFFQNVVHCL